MNSKKVKLLAGMGAAATIAAYSSLGWGAFDCYTNGEVNEINDCRTSSNVLLGQGNAINGRVLAVRYAPSTSVTVFGWRSNGTWINGCRVDVAAPTTGWQQSNVCANLFSWDMYGHD